ncbi:DUF1707 domain-containing protein [Micromonospora sp. WMMD882]|uniref:DUF1707 SHOCT-like domain-containing protein n=1 Tax=Micromonospora sp. WMMD882 TaxID=3015151 RepID=UPI00248C2CAE|nr:DUF1707 domain-containing protein [Micromonospora sp. WMMD882]WBB79169.1 DUF1707 domain-containing protein [Micromonospora sp. WMMD882]
MERRDGMRAADPDREAVAGRLRVALDEGRLDLHEYDDRLRRTYLARTYGELDALVADLPSPAGGVATGADRGGLASREEAATRSVTARWLAETWESYLTVVAVTVSVWAMVCLLDGRLLYFWPAWVAGPWGAVLLVRTGLGLSRGEPRRWAVEQEGKRRRRAEKRQRKRELRADGRGRDITAGGVTDPPGGVADPPGGVVRGDD